MRLFPAIAVAFVVLFCGSTANAQAAKPDDVPIVIRLVLRRLEKLASDTAIKRLRPGATDMSLLQEAPLAELGRLRDASLLANYSMFRRTLERADQKTCAGTWVPGPGVTSESFLQLLASADSTLSQEFAEQVAELAVAGIRGIKSGGPKATQTEMIAAVATARAQLPKQDQTLITRLQAGEKMSAADQCAALRAIYRGYGFLPPQRAAAILRALTGP